MIAKDDSRQLAETPVPVQRRVLKIALALNAAMFVVGLVAGVIGQSSGLIADSLDMLADASGYVIALAAIGRSAKFKINSAFFSGSALLVLGAGVLLDMLRRLIGGSEPVSVVMIGAATLSLTVNAGVLRMLGRFHNVEIHLRAVLVETRVDVIANLAVILAGIIVLATGYRYADLIVGVGIGVYVVKETLELLGETHQARSRSGS